MKVHFKTQAWLVLALCLASLVTGCEKSSSNVLTGRGLDPIEHRPLTLAQNFKAGEAFSLVLKPVRFKDTYLELIIYHLGQTNTRVRKLTLKGIDQGANYLQISNAFSLPFPGRYRISFEQLGTCLGWTEVRISED